MAEIPLHLPTPSVPRWVQGIFAGRIPQRAEAIQPLREVRPATAGHTPVFALRFGESPVEERRLTEDIQAYNAVKDTLETMTDPDRHAQVMATYESLMKRHAAPSPWGVSITVFGRSLFVNTSKTPVPERVDEQFLSPFQPRPSVAPASSPALGD